LRALDQVAASRRSSDRDANNIGGAVGISIDRLVTLDEDELQDAFVWIDWRSFEREVLDGFSEQLDPEDALGYADEDSPTEVSYRGLSYTIPLTVSGCDRYVTIHSVAEIIKDRYTIFAEADSASGSDTHGFLILPNADAARLCAEHGGWVKRHLSELALGIDGFSGIKIPYTGREDNNPEIDEDLARQRAADEKRRRATEARIARLRGEGEKKPFWKFW
jgi:hypothetical protein